MRLCFVCYHGPGPHSAHSVAPELCAEFAKLGIQVEPWFGQATSNGKSLTESYDAVLLYKHSMLDKWLAVATDWNKKIIAIVHCIHPPDVAYQYLDSRDALFCYMNAEVAASARQMFGAPANEWIWSHGCTSRNWPPKEPDPYPAHPIALWCGSLAPYRYRAMLAKIAPKLDIPLHVISIEQEGYIPPGIYHGQKIHGTFDNYLYYADVGLDLAINPIQTPTNSKIFDYLAAGVPIVHERAPGDWLIRRTGLGKCVPFGNIELYIEAVRETAYGQFSRNWCRKFMKEHHSWTQRARELEPAIRRYLSNA